MPYDEELAERLREVLAGEADVHERAMFGGRSFFVNGKMAVTASSRGGLMVRADPSQVPALLARPGAEPLHMRGREMRGWLRVGPDAVRTKAALERWTSIGLVYARSLPPG